MKKSAGHFPPARAWINDACTPFKRPLRTKGTNVPIFHLQATMLMAGGIEAAKVDEQFLSVNSLSGLTQSLHQFVATCARSACMTRALSEASNCFKAFTCKSRC
ncbi:hypothetical protein CCL22_07735 [Pseudomonas syringae]|nr:hypothetical protein CCL22_07735 [Pseudomonas syringae]